MEEAKPYKLTPKQEKFAKAFVETGNGTEAALIAYNTNVPIHAAQMACHNMKLPHVKRAIKDLQENLQEHVYDCLVKTNALDSAVQSALNDMVNGSEDARNAARKFILEAMKQVKDEAGAINKHLHLQWPKS